MQIRHLFEIDGRWSTATDPHSLLGGGVRGSALPSTVGRARSDRKGTTCWYLADTTTLMRRAREVGYAHGSIFKAKSGRRNRSAGSDLLAHGAQCGLRSAGVSRRRPTRKYLTLADRDLVEITTSGTRKATKPAPSIF